jgi:hypothetical protein
MRPTGAVAYVPWRLSHLARAYADIRQFEDARRSVREALNVVETTKEEMSLGRSPSGRRNRMPKGAKVISSTLSPSLVNKKAKSWKLRASMSLARLWRSQGRLIGRFLDRALSK